VTLWLKIVAALSSFMNRVAAYLEGREHKRLGQLEQENAQLKVDHDISDAVDRADPDRVPDSVFDDPANGSSDDV
jgi:hypothetical protein